MPLYNINSLIGKTLVIKKPTNFYRVSDINTFGDKAKPVSNQLKPGYSLTLDSFLLPTEPYFKYGFKYAGRKNTYFTFYGNNGSYYAINFKEDIFNPAPLKEQGIKTVEQQTKEKEQENKTTFETISDAVKDIFKGVGQTGKTLLIVGVSVWAIGYLMEKNKQ